MEVLLTVADTVSFTARSWHDALTGALIVSLLDIDNGAEIRVADGLFLIRVTSDERGAFYRCYIRHVATGQEIVIQGGPELREFVSDCLLEADGAMPGNA